MLSDIGNPTLKQVCLNFITKLRYESSLLNERKDGPANKYINRIRPEEEVRQIGPTNVLENENVVFDELVEDAMKIDVESKFNPKKKKKKNMVDPINPQLILPKGFKGSDLSPSKVKEYVPPKKLESPSSNDVTSESSCRTVKKQKTSSFATQKTNSVQKKTVIFNEELLRGNTYGVTKPTLAEKLKAACHMSGGFDDSDNLE